jgi:LysM repeat protein
MPSAASLVQGAPACQFLLGFATLHDLIPETVGACVENEQHEPLNGDGLQHTTRGLLVWRKLDNWTSFTDGYQTWINGPFGLQRRLNNQRFSWEANPTGLPLADAPAAPLAAIVVAQPQPYDLVDDTVKVAGVGTGFEGVIAARVRDSTGRELKRTAIHAGGTGIWGNFQAVVTLSSVPATPQGVLEVFEPSAKGDGAELHKVVVPITFGQALVDPYHGFAQYTVVAGDTLQSVARHWYGDPNRQSAILEANRHQLGGASTLTPGLVLRIPQ